MKKSGDPLNGRLHVSFPLAQEYISYFQPRLSREKAKQSSSRENTKNDMKDSAERFQLQTFLRLLKRLLYTYYFLISSGKTEIKHFLNIFFYIT